LIAEESMSGKMLSWVIKKLERRIVKMGERSLELAEDPNPRAAMRQFRQNVLDPDNIHARNA
jgi:hypothetical protein